MTDGTSLTDEGLDGISEAGEAGNTMANPKGLALINTSLSADARHVHVHFVANNGQMMTVQLETDVAVRFHRSLGGVLEQTKMPIASSARWH